MIGDCKAGFFQIVAGLLEEMDGPLGGLFDNIWADIDTWKTQQSLQITGIAKPLEGIMDVLGQMYVFRLNSTYTFIYFAC